MERPSAFRPARANVHGADETARRRRREHRNHAGLARDLDVEPNLHRYASTRSLLGRGIDAALFPNRLGDDLFRNLPAARIRDRALVAAAILETFRLPLPAGRIVAAGDLARQAGDATLLRDRADVLRAQASAHVADVLLPWLLPAAEAAGVVALAGADVDAVALAGALASLPERGVALPVVPELLVTVERAPLGPFAPDDPALGCLLAGARDARHMEEWAQSLPDAGIHLGRVVDQLRRATCSDPLVLAGVRELADFVRQQVRGELRSRQAAAAASERDELAAEAHAVAALLRRQHCDRSVPIADVATTLLAGIRILTNALAWDAHFDDRALALRTGDLRHDQSVWDAWAGAVSIDSAATDTAMRSFLAATNSIRRRDHGDRGLLLRPDNSRLTVTRVFDAHDGADVVARFRETGSCWFEIPVESLPTDDDGTPRYLEAVAAGVSVRLVGARRRLPHTVEVRHSGAGSMRLIEDGRVVEQPLSPEAVSIEMRTETNSTFGIVPTPEAPAFALAGRAIAAPWSLRLPGGGADLRELTAIEVQIDLEAFVPADAVTLRRISHPVETIAPGTTARGTVELTAPAPADGVGVKLASSHPEIAEPHDVVVPAGARSARFDVLVHAPSGANHVVLTARTGDGASARVVLAIPASPAVDRTAIPAAAPARAVTTLGDRTFLVVDDDAATAAGAPTRSVIALDETLTPDGTTTAGLATSEIATDPVRNRLFVVNAGARGPDGFAGAGVAMLDAGSLEQLAEWPTSEGVHFAAVDSAAGLVYVSHPSAGRVFVLAADDLKRREVIGDDAFTGALGLAVDPELNRIYVARTHRDGPPGTEVEALTVIQRRSDGRHEIGRTIPVGSMVQPWRVAIDPMAGLVYVIGLGSGTVPPQLIVFDRATLAERGRVHTLSGLGQSRALATRDGTGIVHVTGDAGVEVIEAESMAVVGFVPAPGTACVSAAGGEHVVSASTLGTLVRMRAPRQITTTEWR